MLVNAKKFLIEFGADIKFFNNKKGTVIHYASCCGWLRVRQFIAEKKLTWIEKHIVALHLCCLHEYKEDIVHLLIKSGTDMK